MAAFADRVVACVWVVVGIVVVVAAGDISSGGSNALDALGPKTFPRAIGAFLAVLGLWLLLGDRIMKLIGRAKPAPEIRPGEPSAEAGPERGGTSVPLWRVPFAIVISVAYVALLPVIHYVPATLAASIAMLALLGVRRPALLIVYPVVLTFAAQYAFTEIVGVVLP